MWTTVRSYQGRLNNLIDPRAKQWTGTHIYATTHRNKTANVVKIKHIFIVLVLPTKSVLNIKNISHTTIHTAFMVIPSNSEFFFTMIWQKSCKNSYFFQITLIQWTKTLTITIFFYVIFSKNNLQIVQIDITGTCTNRKYRGTCTNRKYRGACTNRYYRDLYK
jgi:hypothetical protein